MRDKGYSPNEWTPLQPILQTILQDHRDGLSEYELFQILISPPYKIFAADALSNPLSLFQSHFVLYNALYQLADFLLEQETALIKIHCSCIQANPWDAGQQAVVAHDKLRAYYLDWANLSVTDQAQVEAMLDSFWLAFSGMPVQVESNNMPSQQALDLLNLTAPYSSQQLKQQYRKKLHQHHPDKGGTNGHAVQLHQAYQQLKING